MGTWDKMILRVLNRFSEKLLKIKAAPVIVWGLIIGLHTWTDNLGDLIRYQSIRFVWISSPNYLQFFNFDDITKIHHDFIVVKSGHFLGFAIFDFFVFNWLKSHKRAFALSFTFALTTEILQLFFGRDGRLYDVTIDSLGALSVYLVSKGEFLNKAKVYFKARKAIAFGFLAMILATFGALGFDYVQLQPKSHFKNVPVISANAAVGKKKQISKTIDPKLNILLLGSDAKPGESIGHSDTILLVHIDLEKNKISTVSIPRDLRIHLDGYGFTKLASVQYILQANKGSKQGIQDTVKVISDLLGVPVNYYAETNLQGLQSMVDSLGGIQMDVPSNIKIGSQSISAGPYFFDGRKILSLVSDLHSYANGDYGRQQLQLEALKGIAKKALSPGSIPKLPALVHTISKDLIATNLTASDMVSLALEIKNFDEDKQLHYQQLYGADETSYDDILKARNDEIVIDPQQMKSVLAKDFQNI